MALVSKPRLAGFAGFSGLFPTYTAFTATLFNFGGVWGSVEKWLNLWVTIELSGYPSWVMYSAFAKVLAKTRDAPI